MYYDTTLHRASYNVYTVRCSCGTRRFSKSDFATGKTSCRDTIRVIGGHPHGHMRSRGRDPVHLLAHQSLIFYTLFTYKLFSTQTIFTFFNFSLAVYTKKCYITFMDLSANLWVIPKHTSPSANNQVVRSTNVAQIVVVTVKNEWFD